MTMTFRGNAGVSLDGCPSLFSAPEFHLPTEDPPSYEGVQVGDAAAQFSRIFGYWQLTVLFWLLGVKKQSTHGDKILCQMTVSSTPVKIQLQ